jgi:hypothetical protein
MTATALDSEGRLMIVDWSGKRANDGAREFRLASRVKCTSTLDDPTTVMYATGLPNVGSFWQFGNGTDIWAFNTGECSVTRDQAYQRGEPGIWWIVEQVFSTVAGQRCAETEVADPAMEPPRISGSFQKYLMPVEKDRHGKLIKSSSHEIVRGIEKDANRPTVIIEQSGFTLGLNLFSSMVNKVNDAPLWGLDARCIMLTNCSWQRLRYGLCHYYYTRTLEFECRYDTFDLTDVADKGFKVLKGKWNGNSSDPDYIVDVGASASNPKHFIAYQDYRGGNSPTPTLLDHGEPLADPNNPQFLDTIELADEANFLLLGIPTVLG